MAAKYAGLIGRFHLWKQNVKERWGDVKEEGGLKDKADEIKKNVIEKINRGDTTYDHLYRRKTRSELTRISAAVMGIEFAYAAETAFVSPTLLKIGVRHEHMTMIWCLSPLIGFFLTPIMGSLSDRCGSKLGRRRPFILFLSIGVCLGLILVPNGKWIGKQLGDRYPQEEAMERLKAKAEVYRVGGGKQIEKIIGVSEDNQPGGRLHAKGQLDEDEKIRSRLRGQQATELEGYGDLNDDERKVLMSVLDDPDIGKVGPNVTLAEKLGLPIEDHHQAHPWGVFFTILGTVLLDFDADSCQSPSRAYLLDVTLPDDHAVGLSTFTVMAGLGGSLGYAMGALDWGYLVGQLFGGHVRAVFTLVLFIFIVCVAVTMTSFAEIPLAILDASRDAINTRRRSSVYSKFMAESSDQQKMSSVSKTSNPEAKSQKYGSIEQDETKASSSTNPFRTSTSAENPFVDENQIKNEDFLAVSAETSFNNASPCPMEPRLEGGGESAAEHMATLTTYLWSILYMPNSMKVLCLTNLFCWSSLVCYSLYFTDFVGEAVFGGDPQAKPGSEGRRLYDAGVRFGCWGMSLYSLSCSIYSFVIERLVIKFKAKPVYMGGQLVYCVGMIFMAIFRTKWGVILFSWSAGIMYSTLFTMPYLLVAHYHETETFSAGVNGEKQVRGLGTDVALVSCMVFLAQFVLSLSMGSVIAAFESTVPVVVAASILSFCGAITANFVTYLDL